MNLGTDKEGNMSDSTRRMTGEAGPVRVSRNGNARTLTVPAEIASAAEIEVGDEYMVQAIDGSLIYRPVEGVRPRGRFVGTGKDRHYELPRGATMPTGPDPAPVAPIDWDY
jgi:hypothetical protein